MSEPIKVFLSRDDDDLRTRTRALSERIEIVTDAELKARPPLLAQVEIAYGWLGAERLPEAQRLRWLQTSGAGVNGLITPQVRDSKLVITNASGIHAEPITEHMFGLLLMFMRRLDKAREQQQTQQWHGGYDFGANADMLAGKTLGVLGVGAIGGHSARVGQAFGMRVVGLRRSGESHPAVERMYRLDEHLEFFAQSDVVMNTLPLTPKTRGFMGRAEFAALRLGAIVINTGRGATIDTDALLESLRSGHLRAALLDVTDPEPLPPGHPLWDMENVFITPHYSGSHLAYNQRADAIFLDNLRRYLAGEPLTNVVDKNEEY